jgi:hypothetical protein
LAQRPAARAEVARHAVVDLREKLSDDRVQGGKREAWRLASSSPSCAIGTQDEVRNLAHAEWLALLLDREAANRNPSGHLGVGR